MHLGRPYKYILVDGKPVPVGNSDADLLRWATFYEDAEKRIVRQDYFLYKDEKLISLLEEDYVAAKGWKPFPGLELTEEQVARNRIAERKKRELGGIPVKLSTIFLGIDHNFTFEGPPILWETMLFGIDHTPHGEWRYSSQEAALKGHQMILRTLQFKAVMLLWNDEAKQEERAVGEKAEKPDE